MKNKLLLTRNEFREQALKRDNYKCIICGETNNLSVHHIVERRLFPNEGYFIDNAATLCNKHHLEAEMTTLSCDELHKIIKAKDIILPEHLDNENIDKWGNFILPNKQRLPGELFQDQSVQKILQHGNVLSLFSNRIKYPRTFHLPWSENKSDDDKTLENTSCFENKEVVVTIKMDGECSTLYNDYLHARSIEYHPHPSRSWLKQFHAKVCNNIPENWRVCGENLFAKHSIEYNNLQSYFLTFSIWNHNNICLSWNDTKDWAQLLELEMVPVIYEGIWDEKIIKNLYNKQFNNNDCEGYVVRLKDEFKYKDFRNSVAKFVRKNHVTTNNHWLNDIVITNKLIQEIK